MWIFVDVSFDGLSFVEILVLSNYEALRFRPVLALLILTLASEILVVVWLVPHTHLAHRGPFLGPP
jgi:hypothetical protein